MKTQTKEAQAALTPKKSLELLKEGNSRFQANLKANRNLLDQVKTTASGQYPFAVILSCIDSRTSSELVFDQGLGDIFSIRIAGNILNDDIVGSMEFSCKIAGSKLIVVLGHSFCGAIKGALAGVKLGHLTGLLQKIEPAIQSAKETSKAQTDSDLVQETAIQNVIRVVDKIKSSSSVLQEMVANQEIEIVGAMYSVDTGEVDFLRP